MLLVQLFLLLTLFTATAHASSNSSGAFFTRAGVTYETKPDGTAGYTIDLGLPPLPNAATLGGLTVQATGPGAWHHSFTDSFTVSDGQGHSATRTDLLATPRRGLTTAWRSKPTARCSLSGTTSTASWVTGPRRTV